MSVIYLISVVLLWTGCLLVKKSDEKKNALVWSVCSVILVFSVQAFFAGLFGFVHLGVGVVSIGLTNILCAAGLFVWIYKKGRQSYYVRPIDVITLILMLLVVIKFALHRYGAASHINFTSVDASVHMKFAKQIATEHTLPTNMYFSALSTGLFMEAFSKLSGSSPFYMYEVFVVCEIVYTFLSAALMWAVIRERAKSKVLPELTAAGIMLLYWIGYPLYTTLFGFSYFTMSVILMTLLLFLMDMYLKEDCNVYVTIVALNLVLYGVFVCYTLFVPVAFLGCFITAMVRMLREGKENSVIKRLFTKKNVIRMLSIFLIPTVLGLLKSIANVKELSGDDAGIARDGGCYTDLYSNFLLLIPFAMLGGYFLWSRKESGYILPVLFVLLGFMLLMFLGGMLGRVSAYYYMKNNSLLWLYLWVLTAEAIYAMLEKSRLAVAFVLFFAAILGITIYVEPEIMRRNGRFISVSGMNTFHVVYFNRNFYLNDGPLETELIDLYKYVYDNCNDKEVVSVNGEVKNGWFTALTGNEKRFCYGGPDDYKALIDGNTGYVCANLSGEYDVVKDLLEPYPVIFENGAGRIYKLD
ncbi:MAG: hypothetical protein IKO61_02380 [Lachnospiraceae bacterium]|nr:hypothetical protein [Lachnospiraceae bacterium]